MKLAMKLNISRRIALALCAAAAMILAIPAAQAQQYPERPIRFVLGYAAGGGPDVTARVTAQHMSQLLGQSVIVENRLGAGTRF
jgi:tripartite-type tricarboxylate transporter receptor subunit TctC